MSREWKPGDVALLTLSDGRRYIAEVRHDFTRPQWFGSWSGFSIELDSENVAGARPLVVIDPEDEDLPIAHALWERLERLGTSDFRVWRHHIREVLNNLANPTPHIEEPTGLGAVVATEGDGDYVRVSVELLNPWLNVQTGTQVPWDRVNANRVLSEGVKAGESE